MPSLRWHRHRPAATPSLSRWHRHDVDATDFSRCHDGITMVMSPVLSLCRCRRCHDNGRLCPLPVAGVVVVVVVMPVASPTSRFDLPFRCPPRFLLRSWPARRSCRRHLRCPPATSTATVSAFRPGVAGESSLCLVPLLLSANCCGYPCREGWTGCSGTTKRVLGSTRERRHHLPPTIHSSSSSSSASDTGKGGGEPVGVLC